MINLRVNKKYAECVYINNNGAYDIVPSYGYTKPINANVYEYYIGSYMWLGLNIIKLETITNINMLKTIYQLLFEGYIEIWHDRE